MRISPRSRVIEHGLARLVALPRVDQLRKPEQSRKYQSRENCRKPLDQCEDLRELFSQLFRTRVRKYTTALPPTHNNFPWFWRRIGCERGARQGSLGPPGIAFAAMSLSCNHRIPAMIEGGARTEQ